MMQNPEIFFIDKETGDKAELHNSCTSWSSGDQDSRSVNIRNSYQFQCQIDATQFNEAIQEQLKNNPAWATACRLADKLNDLIEEYYAPGTPRKERREIQREFNKIFTIYRKYCCSHGFYYKFTRLDT